jgi:hypothetical protein
MSAHDTDLRQRLLDVQELTPELRDACHKELAAMMEHALTSRTRLFLFALLLALLGFVSIGLRALLFYSPGPLVYGVWTVFTGLCAVSALWVGGALWRGRFLWSSYYPVADVFTVAAALITVLTLTLGLRAPSDPASTFGVLYGLVLLVLCSAWSLQNRIAAAELATRERLLRIECRLAAAATGLKGQAGP